MKRNKVNIFLSIVVILLIVAGVAFLLYDALYLKTPDNNLPRAITTICLLVVTLIRLISGSNRGKSLKFYEKFYEKNLGTAFESRPRYRRKLLQACRLYNQSNYDAALKHLFKLLKYAENRSDAIAVWLFIALCFSDAGAIQNAIQSYHKLLEIEPSHATAHSNLGHSYIAFGDFDAALSHYNRAIELKPDNYFAYHNRASCYFRLGEYDDAITDAKKALEFKNNGVESACLLTIIYALLGDDENKKHYYHLAIASGKNPDDLNASIEYFSSENNIASPEES